MKTSDAGLKFVMKEEGTVLHPYKDIANISTIGCGHVIRPGESFGTITLDQAMELLRNDIVIAENAVNKAVSVPLTQQQFDACVSFSYNNGGGAFASSTLVKLLNSGNVQGAADEFPKWAKTVINGVLQVSQELLGRRKRERALFLTPDAGSDAIPQPVAEVPEPPQPHPIYSEVAPEPIALHPGSPERVSLAKQPGNPIELLAVILRAIWGLLASVFKSMGRNMR